MSSPPEVSRRSFLRTTAAAAGTAALGAPAAHALGANDKLQVGLIGAGRRGLWLAREVARQGQNVVAVCDVAGFRRERAAKVLGQGGQKPAAYSDHRKLLEHKGLDAVLIATPDHWHHDLLLDALKAGKDAYVEKPLARTIAEGREMVKAVRAGKQIVQIGHDRHSGPHWKRCRDFLQSKEFGRLVWVKVWDCRSWVKRDPFAPPKDAATLAKTIDWKAFQGRAPKHKFDPHRYWAWRWFWDYAGGLMTDIGAHQLDLVQWLSGKEKGPRSVVANGGNYYFDYWQTPDVIHGVWDYGDFTATFAVEFINGFDGVGAVFYGTKRTLWVDAEGAREVRVYDTAERIRPGQRPVQTWRVEDEGPAHVRNWLECCKSRKQPNSPVELGQQVIVAAHLANLSYRSGRRVAWDPEKEELVTDVKS